ncbi:S-layer homology domain-containing protein [Bernardetia sp. Wsw4-3y2]|uniref:S-layer homology domain-containing protein n=1 Tax=Bernardetia sp. Wsw4-3y2 TaxID=3127471 RepID=UPI0030D14B78
MKKLSVLLFILSFLVFSCELKEDETEVLLNRDTKKNKKTSSSIQISQMSSTDVAGNWAETEINYMTNNGYMSGYTDGTFRPANNVTRAEFATMIVSCLNPAPKPENANLSFSDISGHWAEQNILKAAKAGYLSGYPDGTFKPQENITKTQTTVAIANGLNVSGGNVNSLPAYFDDYSQIATWASTAIANAVQNKFIINYPDKRKLEPTKNATRADATSLLYRAMMFKNIAPNYQNAYLVTFGLTSTYQNPATKGQAVTFAGKAANLTSVKFYVDNFLLNTLIPSNYAYSFDYTFNGVGTNRALKIEGYNGSTLVTTQNKTITIKDDVVLITSRQQYDVAVGTTVWKLSGRNGFFFENEMTINADGSPNAYNPSNTGLDYLANAGYPGNWWGIATNSSGTPYIQRSFEPTPGYYVSTTAMVDARYTDREPRRYANSETIPFLVLPASKAMGAKLGDFGVIYNQRNGKFCYAIYADVGPTNHLGEASIKAAELLGINNNPKNGGQSGDVVYLVFPNTRITNGQIPTYQTILTEGERNFNEWGGIAQLEYFY